MEVGLLTLEQKNSLVGQNYAPDLIFNPIQDKNYNWVISTQEIENNLNPTFTWVLTLPLIEWVGALQISPSPNPNMN
jgi:hypothetical protein